MNSLAPIVLFTYKRLDTLIQTVEALQKNNLAPQSDLCVFSDTEKTGEDKECVSAVREYIATIKGFKSITIFESKTNKGLAGSIIEGVTQVLELYDSVIVLEDDLVSSANFLNYMNEALNYYKEENKVFSVTGFSISIENISSESDVYFTSRSSSWGWATWKNRWKSIDWEVKDYPEFKKNRQLRRDFNKMGSDMSQMLDRQMQGKINSWAIRWCYHQFKHDLFSVHPFVSKIENVGFNSPDASNTKEKFNRYQTKVDTGFQRKFQFTNVICLDSRIIRQFVKPFSIVTRVKYKILNSFFKN